MDSKVFDDEKGSVHSAEIGKEAIDAFGFADKGIAYTDIIEAAEHMSLEEAKEIIHQSIQNNKHDPNFDQSLLRRATNALAEESLSHDVAKALVEEIKLEAALFNDSPYVEVRSAVSNTDDPSLPVDTFRAWFLGLFFTIIGTGLNTFFAARNPSITLNSFVAQVLSYPMGKALEFILPTTKFNLFGKQCSFNPGPFNQKEHMLITIMANVSFGGFGVYLTDLFFVQRLPMFFNQNLAGSRAGYQILLTLSTQLIGFSLAGMTRRFLVYPPAMIWPANLATIVLNKSFHQDTNPSANGWTISRLRFFLYVFLGYGIYFILPDALLGVLGNFNWITWISPQNVVLALICGNSTGMGLNPFPSLDWSYISLLTSPLISPLFSTVNQVLGMMLLGFPIIVACYWKNAWFSGYLPINSNHLFDNAGLPYNISLILNDDFTFNAAGYAAYSPPYQSAANAVVFFLFFAITLCTLVHVLLYYSSEIKSGFKAVWNRSNARDAYTDVHNKLMAVYDEVPEWWFAIIFIVATVFGIVANEIYDTKFPVWALAFSVIMGAILLVPIGIITAVANVQVTLNVIAEVIAGILLPGRPLAVMIFKSYGIMCNGQAVYFASDMKLGHYVKIPPRSTFWAQLIATIVSVFVALGVAGWQMDNIANICTAGQVSKFSCPGYNTFFNSAIQWGVLGTERLYGPNGIYHSVVYGFLFGALLPFPFYFLTRRYPNSFLKYVSTPVILYGALNFAPYNLSYVIPSLYLALIFQGYIRRSYLPWWTKYNYILSAALTAAISIFGVIWFFALLYHPNESLINWVGNTYNSDSADSIGVPLLTLAADQAFFGPGVGEF